MATSIDRRTAELMVKRLQRKLDNLFMEQQSLNGNKGNGTMRKGGLVKAENGIDNPPVDQNLNFGNDYKDYLTGEANKGNYNWMTPEAFNATPIAAATTAGTTTTNNSGTNFGQIGLQALPAFYNLFKGMQKPEVATPNYNPFESQIRSTMANRRFNINPLLNANLMAQAVNNRNIRNTAGSRGELMGNLGASQNYRMIGDANAYSTKNNADNQYLAEQAQMDFGLGNNRAQMDSYTQDINARNRAATHQFLGQSMNDFSNFGQMQQLMGNQARADKQRTGLIKDMFGVYRFMPGLQDIVNYTQSLRS